MDEFVPEADNWNWIPWFVVRILVLKYNFHWLPLWVVTLSPKTLNVCVSYCTTNRITIKSFVTCSIAVPAFSSEVKNYYTSRGSSLLVSSETAATKQRRAPLRLLPKNCSFPAPRFLHRWAVKKSHENWLTLERVAEPTRRQNSPPKFECATRCFIFSPWDVSTILIWSVSLRWSLSKFQGNHSNLYPEEDYLKAHARLPWRSIKMQKSHSHLRRNDLTWMALWPSRKKEAKW